MERTTQVPAKSEDMYSNPMEGKDRVCAFVIYQCTICFDPSANALWQSITPFEHSIYSRTMQIRAQSSHD